MQAYAVLGPQERGTLVHLGAGRVAMLAAEGASYLDTRGELAAHDGLVCMQLISLLVRRSALIHAIAVSRTLSPAAACTAAHCLVTSAGCVITEVQPPCQRAGSQAGLRLLLLGMPRKTR